MSEDRTAKHFRFEGGLDTAELSLDPKAQTLIKEMRHQRDAEELRSFKQLTTLYVEGEDYQVTRRIGKSGYLFAAWHGGMIERGSDILAERAACSEHSLYLFRVMDASSGQPEP